MDAMAMMLLSQLGGVSFNHDDHSNAGRTASSSILMLLV